MSSKKLLWSCKCGHTITISSTFYLFFFTGAVDPALVLEQIESHIATVKEEAFTRKDILEKVERWLNACEEEAWLEDYNKVRMIVNCIYNSATYFCLVDGYSSLTYFCLG